MSLLLSSRILGRRHALDWRKQSRHLFNLCLEGRIETVSLVQCSPLPLCCGTESMTVRSGSHLLKPQVPTTYMPTVYMAGSVVLHMGIYLYNKFDALWDSIRIFPKKCLIVYILIRSS